MMDKAGRPGMIEAEIMSGRGRWTRDGNEALTTMTQRFAAAA